MPIEVLMPALSPTMKEGNLARWLKNEGDKIEAGDVIAEIETDKATMEVEAVDEGTLGKIIIKDGTENVSVNSLIALILEEDEDKSALDSYQIKADSLKEDKPEIQTEKKSKNTSEKEVKAEITPATPKKLELTQKNTSLKASPVAKRIAQQQGVDINNIAGTGPNGRVIKEDILNFAKGGSGNSGSIQRNPIEYQLEKNGNVRKVIAQRLLESKQSVPHFYLNSEVRIDKLLDLRKTVNDQALEVDSKASYKVSVNDLIIKSVALALKKVPTANSSWSDDAVIIYNNIDISVAVAIDDGLITPIIKNADQKSIIDISNEMKILIKKAREGKLQPEEFQGGGFSISNLGMYGIDSFSAIVNPPQSCILSVGAGIKKPIVENNQITIGSTMNLGLSSDHRSVDGAVGAEFLKALKNIIENPIVTLL